MKVFIRQNVSTKTGYEIVSIDELGNENVQPITDITKDGKSYILPDNPSNRHFWAISRVQDEPVELTYKESKTFGPRDNSQPRKKLEDYLTDEEKAIIEDLMNKAKARKEADKPKPLTEVEKAKIAAQKAQAKYEALLAKSNEEWHLRKEGDK